MSRLFRRVFLNARDELPLCGVFPPGCVAERGSENDEG